MANMLDYLEWRGDLPMEQVPFCDADALVLCSVSYAPFEGIIPEEISQTIPLGEAARLALEAGEAGRVRFPWHMKEDPGMFRMLPDCPRFANIPLSGFRNIIDQQTEEQFCAYSAMLPDGSALACFRGTDNTLVGWKENFNLAYTQAVPAQLDAVRYLCELAAHAKGPLRGIGHSKGGNLAVYAGAFCPRDVQDRLLTVRSFDGPGFNEMVIRDEAFSRLGDRALTVLPQSSVVGMLLEHAEDFQVVESGSVGVFQHNLYEWKIRRGSTITVQDRTNSSHYIDATLKKWVSDMTPELREKMINGGYSLLSASGVTTLGELRMGRNAMAVIRAIGELDPETRAAMAEAMGLLKAAMKDALPELVGRSGGAMKDGIEWLSGTFERLKFRKEG